ncbi:hypothetical protein Tco_0429129 [Tanacetum coccineum]
MSRADPQAAIVSEEQLSEEDNAQEESEVHQVSTVGRGREIQANKREGSCAAKDGEFEDFSDTDSDATTSSSWSDTNKDDDKDDAENYDMFKLYVDISDDDSDKGDDDAARFGVFMYDKSKELPKFTPINPAITCSSMEDYKNLINDQPENELTDLLSRPVFTNAQTTFALEALSKTNVPKAIEESVQAKVLTELKKQLPTYVPKVIATFVQPGQYLNAQDIEPTLRKRPHDDQDPPNDYEGEKRSKRNKDARESSFKSSKKNEAPVDSIQDDILDDKPQDKEEEIIQKILTHNGFLRSLVTVAKKIIELIKKDKLNIANLEGAGLEMLKRQYKNYVELEYHVDQLKAAMAEEAHWSNSDSDLTKPCL